MCFVCFCTAKCVIFASKCIKIRLVAGHHEVPGMKVKLELLTLGNPGYTTGTGDGFTAVAREENDVSCITVRPVTIISFLSSSSSVKLKKLSRVTSSFYLVSFTAINTLR